MLDKFRKYCTSIGIKSRIELEKIDFFINLAQEICAENIKDIFITDFVDSEKINRRQNLWLFSDGFHLESKNYLVAKNIDITPVRLSINWVELTLNDYDFIGKTTDKSRLSVEYYVHPDSSVHLRAGGSNCKYLRYIYYHHLKPNIKIRE